MGLFTKSSILFLTVNALRVITVVAICLAFSAELSTIISDVKSYKSDKSQPPSSSSSSTSPTSPPPNRLARRSHMVLFPRGHTVVQLEAQTANENSGTMSTTTPVRHGGSTPTSSSPPAAATPSSTSSATLPSTSSSSNIQGDGTEGDASDEATNCLYYAHTSVPKEIGGILFSVLNRIFCCIILFLMLISEMPPPTALTQRFWNFFFPPFGEEFGVGVLGGVMVFVGSSMLSLSVKGLPMVSGWLLFIVGFLNMIFGLAFGSKLKSLRSIFTTSTPSPSGSSHIAPSSSYYDVTLPRHHATFNNNNSKSNAGGGFLNLGKKAGGGKGEPIVISAPTMGEVHGPPTYPY